MLSLKVLKNIETILLIILMISVLIIIIAFALKKKNIQFIAVISLVISGFGISLVSYQLEKSK